MVTMKRLPAKMFNSPLFEPLSNFSNPGLPPTLTDFS